jgi:hypothetical protein
MLLSTMQAPPVSGRPGALRRLWEGWKRLGRKLGDVQARLLLSVVYFTVIAPFALAVRWAGDPLAIKRGSPRGWRPRPPAPPLTLERARRQF